MVNERPEPADTLVDQDEPKSSQVILESLENAKREFRDYNEICRCIDAIYSAKSTNMTTAQTMDLSDQEYDTFWSSMEILKPAIYAKAPQVVAKPRYSDASATDKVVAELIERVVNSELDRCGLDMHMREVRDDMALLNRGVLWVTYESEGGKRVCVDHVDRLDYLHEPCRYWSELGWEARCAWMTEREMRKRFKKVSDSEIARAGFSTRHNRDEDATDESAKAPVWEVWSKADDKVYWVTEGVEVILDQSDPFLDLRDFFPAPQPAFGTKRRRTLVPVPDYIRYERHLDQINVLTSRIYTLLDRVRVTGLVPAGGDVADAIQAAMASVDDLMLIPVPGAAMGQTGSEFVQWLPIDVIANTITGLIQARTQLFADFDRLSGISDIMRGETEAEETLGAQRLKGQYGSVRVKDKTEQIVRLARDVARVAVEIICEKFDQKTLLDVSQMTIPTRKEVEHDIEGIRKAARSELDALGEKAKEAAQQAQQTGQKVDPNQAQQMLQQAQQQIVEKYAPDLQRLSNTVVIEDVMKVIRDKRDRGLIIDIETDSTVMTDELAEKQARSELLQAFSGAVGALMPLAQIGEPGVKLFTTMLGFTMQPYTRGNRQIQAQLDELIEGAPEIAQKLAAAQDQGGDQQALVEAQKGLAEAEKVKAQAAMASVQAKSQMDQASNQLKMAQLQQSAADAQTKHQHETEKLQLQIAQAQNDAQQQAAKQQAEIDNLTAQTAKILASIGLDERKQQLSEYTATSNEQAQQVDQQLAAQGQATDTAFRANEQGRADKGEERADRQQDFSERSGDRQMALQEREAERGDE